MGIGPSNRINPANEPPTSQEAGVKKYTGPLAKIWEKLGFAKKVEFDNKKVIVGTASLQKFIFRQLTPQAQEKVGDWRKVSIDNVKNLTSYMVKKEDVQAIFDAELKFDAYDALSKLAVKYNLAEIDTASFSRSFDPIESSDKLKILLILQKMPLSQEVKIDINNRIEQLRPSKFAFKAPYIESDVHLRLNKIKINTDTSQWSRVFPTYFGTTPTSVKINMQRPRKAIELSESEKNELMKTPIDFQGLIKSITNGSPIDPEHMKKLLYAHNIEKIEILVPGDGLKIKLEITYG